LVNASADDFVIWAKNLTKKHKDFAAVDGIEFQVKRGESFGLLGPNGVGINHHENDFLSAGAGAFSASLNCQSPKVVPKSPILFTLGSRGLVNSVTWSLSGVTNGGGTLDRAVLYRQQNGDWLRVAEAAATDLAMNFENSLFGSVHSYTLRVTNEVGESANSRSISLRHAFAPTSKATGVKLTPEESRLRLSWTTPAFIGGFAPTLAEVQVSANDSDWSRFTLVGYTTSLLVDQPAKGHAVSYRVVVENQGGSSAPSDSVRFDNPRTAPGSSFSVSASRWADFVQFRLSAPTDFGGYPSLSMRIERQGVWTSSDEYLLTSPGASLTAIEASCSQGNLHLPSCHRQSNWRD
jgi:hypothetical protein